MMQILMLMGGTEFGEAQNLGRHRIWQGHREEGPGKCTGCTILAS